MSKKKRPAVKNISDRLIKANESFTVHMYDNGYMIEVSGTDIDHNYRTIKLTVSTIDDLIALVREVTDMDLDN